eukprot:m.106116 g.106116  ORF g.106116 m.106116 type:complete len:208 (+) comp21063_c0_seq1:180-803(+)
MPLIESMADMPSAPPGGTAPVPVALPALSTVAVKVIGAVGIITLARGKHNAWTGRMHTDYRTALRHLEEHAAVRVIVVTGRGQRFCVGADTRALEGHVKRGGYDAGVDETTVPRPGFGVSKHFDADFAYHFGLTKPVIAAVNGGWAGPGVLLRPPLLCRDRGNDYSAWQAQLARRVRPQLAASSGGWFDPGYGDPADLPSLHRGRGS